MFNRKSLKLLHKLTLGMLAITAVGLIVAFIIVNTMLYGIVHNNVLESTRRERMIQAQQVDAWFETATGIVANLSETLPHVDSAHYQDIVVHYFNRFDFMQSIWIAMADGTFYDSDFWVPPEGFVSQERPWWLIAATTSGEVRITLPYISAETGGIVTTLARHTQDWGGQEGAIAMAFDLEQLEAMINDFQARTEGYLFLVGPGGEFVIHPNPQYLPSASGLQSMPEIERYADIFSRFREGEDLIEYADQHGTPSYFMQFPLPSIGWYLVSVVPMTVTSDPVNQVLSAVILIMVLILIIVTVFSFVYVSRGLVKPVKHLTTSAGEMAAESLAVSIDRLNIYDSGATRTDEIGALYQAIQNMLREIVESHEKERETRLSLEQREKLLHSVNQAALTLLAVEDESEIVSLLAQTMEMIGKCLNVDRIHLSRCNFEEGAVSFSLISNWYSELGRSSPILDLDKKLSLGTLRELEERLMRGDCFNGPVTNLPAEAQEFLNPFGTLKSIIIIPMFLSGTLWGFITVDDCEFERELSEKEMNILHTVSLMFTSVFGRFAQKELAITDALTGVRNRRYFEEISESVLKNCIDENRDFSVIITDIDHFKSINDRFGHIIGDDVLKIFTARMRHVLKQDTLLARYGGEEFVIALPGVSHDDAVKTAWRLNKVVADSPFVVESLEIAVTASFGVASITTEFKTIPEIMSNADKALYDAKATGRNTVVG